MQDLKDMLDSIDKMISHIGVGWFVGILVGLAVVLGVRRLYYDRRADAEKAASDAEKEKTIQRVADEVRFWKVIYLRKVEKLSEKEIEQIINLGGGVDPKDSRERLERASSRNKGDTK